MLHRFATVVAACTLFLIVAGGMVTSTSSGLSVPDWPTMYGYSMFSFPLSKMVGGIFYEHGHRLIASTVGFLTIILAVWLQMRERRRWVRRLGWLALAAVIVQGTLGGITVLFFLPAAVSIGHAALAQLFFCLTVSLAVVTSPRWIAGYGADECSSRQSSEEATLYKLTAGVTLGIYAQILLGAAMRHTGAGLAIPDFPTVFGGILPPAWTPPVALHYAHRVGAALVAVAVFWAARYVRVNCAARPELRGPTALLCALVVIQIALGGWTVLSGRLPLINTAHVATGAMVLATSLMLTLRAHRTRLSDVPEEAMHRAAGATRIDPRPSIGVRA